MKKGIIESIIEAFGPDSDLGILNIELMKIIRNIHKLEQKELVERIQKDPNVVFSILKTVNSPFFMSPVKIKSIEHAVIYLGREEIKRIIILASMIDTSEKIGLTNVENSLFVGFALKVARTTFRIIDAYDDSTIHHSEDAFIAGLLVAFGKLILKKVYPDKITEINGFWENIDLSAERSIFGADFISLSTAFLSKFHMQHLTEEYCHIFDMKSDNFLSQSLTLSLFIVNIDSHDDDVITVLEKKNLLKNGYYELHQGIDLDANFIRSLETRL